MTAPYSSTGYLCVEGGSQRGGSRLLLVCVWNIANACSWSGRGTGNLVYNHEIGETGKTLVYENDILKRDFL
jgi:hypothetical protein